MSANHTGPITTLCNGCRAAVADVNSVAPDMVGTTGVLTVYPDGLWLTTWTALDPIGPFKASELQHVNG